LHTAACGSNHSFRYRTQGGLKLPVVAQKAAILLDIVQHSIQPLRFL